MCEKNTDFENAVGEGLKVSKEENLNVHETTLFVCVRRINSVFCFIKIKDKMTDTV